MGKLLKLLTLRLLGFWHCNSGHIGYLHFEALWDIFFLPGIQQIWHTAALTTPIISVRQKLTRFAFRVNFKKTDGDFVKQVSQQPETCNMLKHVFLVRVSRQRQFSG